MTTTNNAPAFTPNTGEGKGYASAEEYYANLDAAEARVAANAAAKRAGAHTPSPAKARATAEAKAAGLAAPASTNTNASTGTSTRDSSVQTSADAERQAAIDSIVSALKASGADMTSATRQATPNMLYSSADDAITFTSTLPSPTPGVEPQALADEGRDLQSEYAQAVGRVKAIEDQLAAFKHDAKTGEKVYEVTGEARASLEARLARERLSAGHDIERIRALHEQRARLANTRSATSNEAIIKAAYSRGDSARAKVLEDAITRAEADELAKTILAARRAGR